MFMVKKKQQENKIIIPQYKLLLWTIFKKVNSHMLASKGLHQVSKRVIFGSLI